MIERSLITFQAKLCQVSHRLPALNHHQGNNLSSVACEMSKTTLMILRLPINFNYSLKGHL